MLEAHAEFTGRIPTHESLVHQLRSGDPDQRNAAFNALEPSLRPVLRFTLVRAGIAPDDVEDVLQDVYILIVQFADRLRQAEAFTGWCAGIARRSAYGFHRRKPHEQQLLSDAAGDNEVVENESLEDPIGDPAKIAVRAEEAGRAVAALGQLREMDRTTLNLRYLEEKSLAEMQVILAVPLGTVKRRLHVALCRLAEKLGTKYVPRPRKRSGHAQSGEVKTTSEGTREALQ